MNDLFWKQKIYERVSSKAIGVILQKKAEGGGIYNMSLKFDNLLRKKTFQASATEQIVNVLDEIQDDTVRYIDSQSSSKNYPT